MLYYCHSTRVLQCDHRTRRKSPPHRNHNRESKTTARNKHERATFHSSHFYGQNNTFLPSIHFRLYNCVMHSLQPKLAQKCLRIQEDDPRVTRFSTPWFATSPDFCLLLGQSLQTNSHLVKLHLRNLVVTVSAAKALARGIAHSQLKQLEWEGHIQEELDYSTTIQQTDSSSETRSYRSGSSTTAIQQILCHGIQSSLTIESIRFIRFPVSEHSYELANTLSMLHSLQSLSICGFQTHQNGRNNNLAHAQLISEVLIRSTSLKRLELHDGELGDNNVGAMLVLSEGLQYNQSLKTLELNCCNIGDEGIELLIQHWHPKSTIHSLNLFRNAIGPIGAQRLVQAIVSDHPGLQRLDLSENNTIGYEGLHRIGSILMNRQQEGELRLAALHLLGCAVWNKSHDDSNDEEALTQHQARHLAGQALLEAIKGNTHLKELTVFRNSFPAEVKNGIGFYAGVNRKGRNLLSYNDDHDFVPTVWCHILAKCQHKVYDHSLTYFFLREQPTLVQLCFTCRS